MYDVVCYVEHKMIIKLLILFFFFFRKKKKEKELKKLVEVATVMEEETPTPKIKRTKAEMAFQQMKEKPVRTFYLKYIITFL